MISCVRELRIVYSPVETAGPLLQVGRPSDAAAFLRERIEHEPVEVCVVLLLTTKHQAIAVHEMGRGTLDSCPVHPRDVFTSALLANAAGVIVAHNHPSGDPTPSAEDVALSRRLHEAGLLLGINVLDHVIVTAEGRYHSLADDGLFGGAR